MIRIDHVSRIIASHVAQTVILNDVTVCVPRGGLFAINGPSGSGKSTLLNMMTGIDRPSQGRVIVEGRDLEAMNENALARWRGRHVGIVFQFFQLIPTLTVLENVLLALELGGGGGRRRREWRNRAMECLELAHIAHHPNRLPSQLSGGEQQRVAIARALANDPPIIVADEPTGNLDSHTAHEVFDTLVSLTAHDKTVIYVTHAADLANQASYRIDLLDGKVVATHGLANAPESSQGGAGA